jgi:peptide/nickel transport system ATP-binding protein
MAGIGTDHLRPSDDTLLRVEHLVVRFPAGGGNVVHAVDDVSLDVRPGETLGIVGESGSGKSTTGRAIMQLPRPTSGSVRFGGRELTTTPNRELRMIRRRVQMVFQDPVSSLNPRRRVRDIVAEPLRVIGASSAERLAKVEDVFDAVGLDLDRVGERRAHEFSGGQCQRISIARSLVMDPELLICDEPVSALDVSVQAQVLNLLKDAKQRYRLTMVFIAHDLGVVRNISNRVAVMYLGRLCEVGAAGSVYDRPAHPYTAALLDAVPVPDPARRPDRRLRLEGEIPSPIAPPSGCHFRTRCPRATARCAADVPLVRAIGDDHFVACHYPLSDDS